MFIHDYDYPDIETPDNTGYCPQCKRNVETQLMDFGIGAYEYWGSKEVHTDIRTVCAKCEEEVQDEPDEEEDEE